MIKRILKRLVKVADVLFFIWRWLQIFIRWIAQNWKLFASLGSLTASVVAFSLARTTEGRIVDTEHKLSELSSMVQSDARVVEKIVTVEVEVPKEITSIQIVEKIKEIPVIKEVTIIEEKIIEKEVVKEVPVQVIVEVPVTVEILPKDFEDFVSELISIEDYADKWEGNIIDSGFETQTDKALQKYNALLDKYKQ